MKEFKHDVWEFALDLSAIDKPAAIGRCTIDGVLFNDLVCCEVFDSIGLDVRFDERRTPSLSSNSASVRPFWVGVRSSVPYLATSSLAISKPSSHKLRMPDPSLWASQ